MYHRTYLEHDVIEMIATEKQTSLRKAVFEKIIPLRIRRRNLENFKDDSIQLRRHLAAEIAYLQFEQHKERALTENHRAGFMR
jgi:hypothetical protein